METKAFSDFMDRAMLGTDYCAKHGLKAHTFKPRFSYEPQCNLCGQTARHIIHDPGQRVRVR